MTRFVAQAWTSHDGLPQSSVLDIDEDADGFLWLATYGGLARFDGRRFRRVDKALVSADGHRFRSVHVFGKEVLAGTDQGRVFAFDRFSGTSREVDVPKSSRPVVKIREDAKGRILLVGDGVWRQESSGWKQVKPHPKAGFILDAHPLADGTLWVLSDSELTCTGPACLQPTVWRRNAFASLSLLDGRVWVTSERGVESLDDTGQLRPVPVSLKGPHLLVKPVAPNMLWMTDETGLVRLHLRSGLEERVQLPVVRATSEADHHLHSFATLFLDSRGSLWLGSNDAGFMLVKDRRITQIAAAAGLEGRSSLIAAALPDGGAIISTYCEGMQRLVPPAVHVPPRVVRIAAVSPEACVSAFFVQGESVFAGVGRDLLRVSLNEENIKTKILDGRAEDLNAIQAILPAGENRFLLGTRSNGVIAIQIDDDKATIERSFGKTGGLPHATVNTLTRLTQVPTNAGNAATQDDVIAVATNAGLVGLQNDRVVELLTPESRRSVQVRDVQLDADGTLWAASYGGGLLWAPRPAPGRVARRGRWLMEETGFCADVISRIVLVPGHDDTSDTVWINGNSGVFWVDQKELVEHATDGRALACNFVDSGEGNGGATPAGERLRDGALLFPTIDGLVLIDPEEHVRVEAAPPSRAWIEHAEIGGMVLAQGTSTTVPPGKRDLSLVLVAPKFSAPFEPQFEVVVQHDGKTSRHRGGSQHVLSSLAPGHYELSIRHLVLDGRDNRPRLLSFYLRPAWFERDLVRVGTPVLAFLLLILLARIWVGVWRGRARALAAELAEKRAAERAREERDVIYQTVFEGSPAPLLLFSLDGALLDVNEAGRAMIGPDQGEPKGLAYVSPDDRQRFRDRIAGAASPRTNALSTSMIRAEQDFEFEPIDPNHLHRLVQLAAAPLKRGGQTQVLIALTDVTNAREDERQRSLMAERTEAARRLESLGRLSGGIAHDFNNVLATLLLQLGQLKTLADDPEEIEQIRDEMRETVERGVQLTQRFLSTGRQSNKVVPTLLDEGVEQTCRVVRRLVPKKIEVQLELLANGESVDLAPGELDQLVSNLVINAGHATSSSHPIVVRTRVVRAEEVEATRDEGWVLPPLAGDCVDLSVEDGGSGISDETLRVIFEPFFTTKGRGHGSGMGLNIVHRIARIRCAGVKVSSAVDHGTTIIVRFPLDPVVPCEAVDSSDFDPVPSAPVEREPDSQAPETGENAPVDANKVLASFSRPSLSILVCDDQASIRRGLRLALEQAGAAVIEAEDGADAMKILSGKEGESVDIVITDFLMPLMNGVELIESARERWPTLRLLLLSGYIGDTDVLGRVPDDVVRLQKPVDPDDLISIVDELMSTSPV